jgi:hypothetical protein
MKIRRKDLPRRPARKQERSVELELELPLPPPEEIPGLSEKKDETSQRGEMIIDMFGSDDHFCL